MTQTNPYPIPKRYLTPPALAARGRLDRRLSRWVTDSTDASGAILVGPTGIGKTLAASWLADLVTQARSPTWVKWIRADELSRLLSDRGGSEQVTLLKLARLLVVDELGYERFPELFLEVLGARHDNDRPTVVTSGLGLQALADRYSDATIRRIVQVGNGCVVDCTSPAKPMAVAK